MERRSISVPRSWAWTVLMGAFAVLGVLVMVGVAMLRQGERIETLAQRLGDVAVDAKAASEANNAILKDARERDLNRQPTINAAIKRIIDDNAEAHAALLGEIARLVNQRECPR